ncbi:hypothetical protein NUW58_g5903 [Xylaria curta]|uniref:Uncharacterized protein n=1 Tax=Xylaria curta TaxID=42375 RepID=A0ACC1P0V5_9PEZI|nr:hypothetical protein NUW58_g5903 [Xylaria curta]
MSSKRKFSEYSAGASVADETRGYEPSHPSSKYQKKKAPSKDKPTSINWLKKRARTIERRLNREDSLPANVKHDLEKELDHHKQKLDDLTDGKRRSAMIKKYHMVRFFERKKADRLAKQIRTQLKATTDEEERQRLEADLHIAEVDALYARYFPHRERYVSLYPVSSLRAGAKGEAEVEDSSAAARSLRTERPPLWNTIEKAAKRGTSALVQIQERRSAVDSSSKLPPQERPTRPSTARAGQGKAKNSSTSRSEHQELPEPSNSNGEDDSDGGFFEEG